MNQIFRECLEKFGDILGMEIWEAINSVFDVLPFSAVIDDKVIFLFKHFLLLIKLCRFYVYMVVFQVRVHVQMSLYLWLMIFLYH